MKRCESARNVWNHQSLKGGIFKIHKRSDDLNHLLCSGGEIHRTSAGNSCNKNPFRTLLLFLVVKDITGSICVSSIMWHGVVKKTHRIMVAVATPVLYSAILMKIGVECSPSSFNARAYIGFHAGCPFTRHCSAFLTKGLEAIRLLYLFIMFRLPANGLRCSPNNCA